MARQAESQKPATGLINEFKEFIIDWYNKINAEPIEIKIDYWSMFNTDVGNQLNIWIEYSNDKKELLNIVSRDMPHVKLNAVTSIICEKFSCTNQELIKQLSFIIHIFIVFHEWLREKSKDKSLFVYPWQNSFKLGIFDFDEIIEFRGFKFQVQHG